METHLNPWETEEGKAIWNSQSEYFMWLRGAIRRIWSDYPLRKEWKKRQLRALTLEEKERKLFHPSTKNVGQCYYCKDWMAGSKLECDHKISSEGCKNKEEAEKFLWYCGGQVGDGWVLACKPCHKIKSYAERKGIPFEEAFIEKQAIQIIKGKREKEYLIAHGVVPAGNAAARRKQLVEVLHTQKNSV